jgi:hypothetical protein
MTCEMRSRLSDRHRPAVGTVLLWTIVASLGGLAVAASPPVRPAGNCTPKRVEARAFEPIRYEYGKTDAGGAILKAM